MGDSRTRKSTQRKHSPSAHINAVSGNLHPTQPQPPTAARVSLGAAMQQPQTCTHPDPGITHPSHIASSWCSAITCKKSVRESPALGPRLVLSTWNTGNDS